MCSGILQTRFLAFLLKGLLRVFSDARGDTGVSCCTCSPVDYSCNRVCLELLALKVVHPGYPAAHLLASTISCCRTSSCRNASSSELRFLSQLVFLWFLGKQVSQWTHFLKGVRKVISFYVSSGFYLH